MKKKLELGAIGGSIRKALVLGEMAGKLGTRSNPYKNARPHVAWEYARQVSEKGGKISIVGNYAMLECNEETVS